MLQRQRRSRIALPAVVAFLFVWESASSLAQEGPVDVSRGRDTAVLLHPSGLNGIVRMAVLEAHRRLGDANCQEIFSDFKDASDRTLQEKLDSIGQTGQSYLSWIWFRDAALQGLCARSEVLAFTTPGSQVVSFCGEQFTGTIHRQGLGRLAIIVLHEELHSLGLGEDPPTSVEITRRVEARCGS